MSESDTSLVPKRTTSFSHKNAPKPSSSGKISTSSTQNVYESIIMKLDEDHLSLFNSTIIDDYLDIFDIPSRESSKVLQSAGVEMKRVETISKPTTVLNADIEPISLEKDVFIPSRSSSKSIRKATSPSEAPPPVHQQLPVVPLPGSPKLQKGKSKQISAKIVTNKTQEAEVCMFVQSSIVQAATLLKQGKISQSLVVLKNASKMFSDIYNFDLQNLDFKGVALTKKITSIIIDIFTCFGNVYYCLSDFKSAVKWFESCLQISQNIYHDKSLLFVAIVGRVRAFSSLGLCLTKLGDLRRAVRFQVRALASLVISEPGKLKGFVDKLKATVLNNLAVSQFEIGRYIETTKHLTLSINLFEKLKHSAYELARVNMNNSVIFSEISRVGLSVSAIESMKHESELTQMENNRSKYIDDANMALDTLRAIDRENAENDIVLHGVCCMNITALLIILFKPIEATKCLIGASFKWNELLKGGEASASDEFSGILQHVNTNKALFNISQILFSAGQINTIAEDSALLEEISKIMVKIVKTSEVKTSGLPSVIDPELLIKSLKVILERFTGSSNPHAAQNFNQESSAAYAPPVNSKPSKNQIDCTILPIGHSSSHAGRTAIAISKSLITIYSRNNSISARRQIYAKKEALKWAREASIILGNVAEASLNNTPVNLDSLTIGSETEKKKKRVSTVVNGSELEGLLVTAVSETGECHGILGMEVGSVVWQVEQENEVCGDIIPRLVKLLTRRVKDGVVGPVRRDCLHNFKN